MVRYVSFFHLEKNGDITDVIITRQGFFYGMYPNNCYSTYYPTFYRHNGEKCGPGLKPAGPLSIALSGAREAEGRRRAGKLITSSLALSSPYWFGCPGLDVAFLDTSKFVLIETAVGDRDVSKWKSFLSTSSSSSSTASQLCTRFLWFDVSAPGATPL